MTGALGSLSPAGTLALGIVVGLLSTCVQSVGLTLQRKSHMLEDEKAVPALRRPAYRRRRWQVGMLLFLVANVVGSSIQITTLPLPLLSTLQASGLVFNSLLASLLLQEPWTLRTGYGTVLVAAGAVLISLFSALPEPSHSLHGLLRLLGHRSFLVWFALSLVFVAALLVVDLAVRKVVPVHRRESPRVLLLRGMSYGAVSGILSAHALLLAKSAVELIVRSVADKQNQFSNYRSWLLILAFLVLALSQLYYLHLGLRLISTSVLYPFVFCIYNIVAILDGLIYFRQMDRLPPLHAGLIALGTVILLAGVLALSWRLQDDDEESAAHDHAHTHHIKHEIPQTLLAPGLGFVGDPSESDDNSESALAEDDDYTDPAADATRPLLPNKGRKRTLVSSRGSRSTSETFANRKRRRAATLKDVVQIWEERDDDDEERYGTFDANGPTRPASAGHERRRRSGGDGRGGEEAGVVVVGVDGAAAGAPPRARTMSAVGGRGERRRRSTHEGGALFSELLKVDWWRARRKGEGEGDDEGTGG
ncbi:hypothetical protein LTR08_008137 [Meristemomyces frigidus]|nr:hypothetical protein LTR08_008137 [Meristemomyces frigidus]